MNKLNFKGTITSIQPRIRLTRSFDEASHTYLGYAIRLEGKRQINRDVALAVQKVVQSR
jgi:hypothetical protein